MSCIRRTAIWRLSSGSAWPEMRCCQVGPASPAAQVAAVTAALSILRKFTAKEVAKAIAPAKFCFSSSWRFVLGKAASMSEQSIASGQEFGSRHSDPADPVVANLQQSAKLANENCDRAVALNQTLSAQLREAQDRINQLEREADELGEQLLMEARAIIQDVQSNADGRVKRTIREPTSASAGWRLRQRIR
jgi:hypothetical protein